KTAIKRQEKCYGPGCNLVAKSYYLPRELLYRKPQKNQSKYVIFTRKIQTFLKLHPSNEDVVLSKTVEISTFPPKLCFLSTR
ncbi:hypothetical protein, partial [Lactobacillus psittaci]|uniref:hypothetical protein n=1 Tax=Lactobacillus psittaci TaxID=116089 RepID=UPI001F1A3EE1